MTDRRVTRRGFLGAQAAAAAAFTIVRPELVRGFANEKIKVGLVGCGSRGTQAVLDNFAGCENVELVAMGDAFQNQLDKSLAKLKASKFGERVKVDSDHSFVGLDAYRRVLASEIDLVMLATPPGFRPIHFEAAVEAKKHIFCEKPFGTDAAAVRRFMAAAKKSEELKLCVKSGAQRRSHAWYLDQLQRVRSSEIGEILACFAYWEETPPLQFLRDDWPGPAGKRDPKWGDIEFQLRNWYSFVWICGDQIVEQHLHNIDVCNWFMGAHPMEATASGGAAWRPRQEEYGNIYDHLCTDFVYSNGVHMTSRCRQYRQPTAINVSELIVGSKGKMDSRSQRSAKPPRNPYEQEHIDLVNSILGKTPYINEAMAVAESTMTALMGREAAYSGQKVTWDMMMKSERSLLPTVFEYAARFPAPPLAVPGEYKFA